MVPTDDVLAPGRALESLVRRAARGNRAAWRLLMRHGPRFIEAECRWLYPALLHRSPGGAHRAQTIPFAGEHEQMLELFELLARSPAERLDPMFRAAHWLVLRHSREERRWLEELLAARRPRDDAALRRFVAHCRPLVEGLRRLSAGLEPLDEASDGSRADRPGRAAGGF
jgi:hypothetical protein